MDGEALLKTRRPLVFCGLNCAPVRLSLHMETAGYVRLNRRYTHESVKAEAKRKLIYLLLRLCRQRDGEQVAEFLLLDIFIGCFYLSILTGEESLSDGGFFGGFSRTSCSGFYSASHFKEPTSNL